MTVANDAWIRKMAKEHGMIVPFEEGLVTKGKISYGVSSYGYDVRVGSHFKIFHNLNSTLVDPKAFDSRSFVDHDGPECIIPPNSFVLAETVERFRIPRDVICVCLGKCVTGDTRVVDAETGAYVPIRDFAGRRTTVGLSGWDTGRLTVSDFIPQGRKPVFELRTRLGHRIRATANHPFRRYGGWTALEELVPGDRIAAARSVPTFGRTPLPEWEAALLGFMVSEGQCVTPGHSPVFTNADPELVRAFEWAAREGLGVDVTYNGHLGYRLVNHEGRGGAPERNRAAAWLERHGAAVKSADKSVPEAVFTAPRESVVAFLRALFSGDGSMWRQDDAISFEYTSMSRRLIEDINHLLSRFGIVSLMRDRRTHLGTVAHRLQITHRGHLRLLAEEIGFWPRSEKQVRLEEEFLPELVARGPERTNFDTLPREAWGLVRAAADSVGLSARAAGVAVLNSRQSLPYRTASVVAMASGDEELGELSDFGPVWDVVESIEPAGEDEVFDISVPGAENFLANGLFVHNSTYARCFTADTRVALVDGTSPTLEEMAQRAEGGEPFFGYSVGEHGRIVVTLLDRPRWIGRDPVVEVTLDSGEKIRCTPDHEFLRRDGTTAPAERLRAGESLMPLYRELVRGYESVYQPLNGHLIATHRLADEWNVRHQVYGEVPGTHRHHVDHDRRNNNPWNIARIPAGEHVRHHNALSYGPEFDAAGHGDSIRAALERLGSDPEWRARQSRAQHDRAVAFWTDPGHAAARERARARQIDSWDADRRSRQAIAIRRAFATPETRERHADGLRRAWASDPARRERQAGLARSLNRRDEVTADVVRQALHATGSIRAAARLLGCDRSVFRRSPEVVAASRGAAGRPGRNHKVVSVRGLSGEHDVYCLTVPEAGNFALAAGVFVRNCGIIVNVTPLEPEWEGVVTIEISNTTPLPAKIYSNEGIAQILFLRAAADGICETSYADRKGKYQAQKGLTLPKVM
jgi:dCTP deaminase